MTDKELRDAAVARLKQTTTGYLKSNGQPKPPPWPENSGNWKAALDLLAQIGGDVPPPPTGFQFALGSNGNMLESAITGQTLGVKLMRTYDRNLGASASSIVSDAAIYQSRGIEPYLLYDVQGFPGSAPGNIGAHAAAVGPGGANAHASLPVRWFEIGNEMLYKYRPAPYGPEWADEYTRGYISCYQAVKAANPNVKLMFSIDTDAGGSTQYNRIAELMYSVDPKIHEKVDAWVLHHYGPMSSGHTSKVVGMLDAVKAKGAPDSIPVVISEDGVASDNGRSLDQNWGYPVNLTWDQAGQTRLDKVRDMRAHPVFGSRLHIWTNYQARDLKASGSSVSVHDYEGAVRVDGSAKGGMTQAIRELAA